MSEDTQKPETSEVVKGFSPLMPMKGFIFRDQAVRLDNIHYENCQFINCTVFFGGTGSFGLINNEFDHCKFIIDGAATQTMVFLSVLRTFAPEIADEYLAEVRDGTLLKALGVHPDDQ